MKIVLAIDGSKFSDAAVQAVIAQVRPQDTEIRVLNVLQPPSEMAASATPGYNPAFDAAWWWKAKEHAQLLVEKTAELLRSNGLERIAAGVEQGEPKSTILGTARDWHADLIVLGSHGRKGLMHFLVGSVSETVARHAACSVEIVRIATTRRKAMRILLAIDGSKFSEAAARVVMEQFKPEEAEVRILNVVDIMADVFPEMTEYCAEIDHAHDPRLTFAEGLVESTAELLRSRGLTVTTVVECGEPRSKIIDASAKWNADLIIVGSHGLRGWQHFFLGSVSDAVARHAACSVEIVRIPPQR